MLLYGLCRLFSRLSCLRPLAALLGWPAGCGMGHAGRRPGPSLPGPSEPLGIALGSCVRPIYELGWGGLVVLGPGRETRPSCPAVVDTALIHSLAVNGKTPAYFKSWDSVLLAISDFFASASRHFPGALRGADAPVHALPRNPSAGYSFSASCLLVVGGLLTVVCTYAPRGQKARSGFAARAGKLR